RTDKEADPEKKSQQILDEAEKIFLQSGISKELISTRLRTGKPAEEIIREVENENCNMIIMGRKGRGAIKDLLLGGVSKTVLQHCQDQTIAIVSSDD
ncbi:MAG TPA: universal stress protein, partial [Nitrospirae bacterium]|nr:universal stress protein [Nitrospirota bacterium]